MTHPVSPPPSNTHQPPASFPRPQGSEIPARIYEPDQITTGEAVQLDIRPATPFATILGGAVDLGIHLGIVLATYVMLLFYAGGTPALNDSNVILALVIGLIVFPTVLETLTRGRSVGKWITGVRIVRDDGGALTFRHAIIRSLLGLFEILMTSGSIAVISTLFTQRHKRLGDLLAGTYPIQVDEASLLPPPLRMPPELVGWAQRVDVSRLPVSLAWDIRRFLNYNSELTPTRRHGRAQALAAAALNYVSLPPPPGTHPERFLAATAVIRRDIEYRHNLQVESQLRQQLHHPAPYGLEH